jgi:carboxypeptidase C (cathepsin A)
MVKAIAREVSWNEKDSHGGNPSFPMTKWRLCEKLGESKYSTISLPGSSTPYGNYVRSGHFNYVRVFGSGHMIQENHPKEAKHLFESWVLDRDSFQECIPF